MSLVVYDVTLRGRSPYLMHRFPIENGGEGNSRTIREDLTPAQEAERSAYRKPDGELYIPAEQVEGAVRDGARFHKIGKRAAWPLAAAAVRVCTRKLGLGTKEYAVDTRSAVIPSTRGRIVRHRAMIADWQVSFEVEVDTELYSDSLLRKVVFNDAGVRCGIGDFRPGKGGPYGRFDVLRLEARPG